MLRLKTKQVFSVIATAFLLMMTMTANTALAKSDKEKNIDRLSDRFNTYFYNLPEEFTEKTGAVATIFVKDGDDFVRVSTSVKKDGDEKTIGTTLGKSHPGYQNLMDGKPYSGKATLFGKEYMTKYVPVKTDQGKTIAILFVGIPQ